MLNYYWIIGALFILFSGCASFDAKIEFRDDESRCLQKSAGAQSAYLVNTSKTQISSFTVRATKNYNKGTTTQIYTLNPGEEIFIGCTVEVFRADPVTTTYEVTGQVEEK